MIQVIIKRSIGVVLAMAILTDIALLVRLGETRRRIQAAIASFENNPSTPAPRLSAWTLAGERVLQQRGSAAIVVRYASSTCAFSTNDPIWEKLSARLDALGIHSVVLLPGESHKFEPEKLVPRNAPQVLHVGGDWARRYALAVTPTVLIFDATDRLIWHKHGVLVAADADRALEAVRTARRDMQARGDREIDASTRHFVERGRLMTP